MDILIASGNKNKILELQTIARSYAVRFVSPVELKKDKNLGEIPEVDEYLDTYEGNARLKAEAFSIWGSIPCLADDSGLAVDLLNGRPGVHSARYGGPRLDDLQRCAKLIEEIESLDGFAAGDVSARFHCSLVYCEPNGKSLAVEETLEGRILERFVGDKGFGYDPVVYINELDCTLAELSFDELCLKGFRAKAFARLASALPEQFPEIG